MSMVPSDRSSRVVPLGRLSLFVRSPGIKALLQGLFAAGAAVAPPAVSASLTGGIAAVNAYRAELELRRLQDWVGELADRVEALSRAGVTCTNWNDNEETVEWFLDALDRVRRVRGEDMLRLLGALTAGVLRDDTDDIYRDLDKQVWEIAASLSTTELRLLLAIWGAHKRLAELPGFVGLIQIHQLRNSFTMDRGLTWTYLTRLEGLGLLVSPIRSDGGPDELSWSRVTLEGDVPGFLMTKLGLALFDLCERGGWIPDQDDM